MPDIGNGVLFFDSDVNSGTGNYNSFLRIQNDGEEQGFNTDTNSQLNNKDGIWTHSLLISSLQTVDVGGTLYYEIRLDLNETNSKTGPNISLDQLQIFFGDAATTSLAGLTEIYNLQDDHGGSLALVDDHTGSGSDDYVFYVPVSLVTGGDYLTLYADFSGADGGFEEFRVKSLDANAPAIHLEKDASVTAIDEGTPTDITYTYVVTNTSSDPSERLMLTTLIDDNGTPSDSSDDFDVLAVGTFVGGDTDGDGFLDTDETWTYTYTREDVVVNAGNLTNTAGVNGIDEHGNNATDDDTATVTVNDVLPAINIDKVASVTQIQAGTPTDVTFTYSITNTSSASTDPITLTHLVDDAGTPGDTSDDFILFDGDSTLGLGPNYVSGDDGDGLLEKGETWIFNYTVNDLVLDAGETRTNIATVTGHDDEDNSVSDTDDATVTAFNLGRTPGFWANLKNGGKLWDGNDSTWPNGGDLGTTSIASPGHDLAYRVYDLNGDGDTSDTVNGISEAVGSRGYLMIGDWNHNGLVDSGENVLVVSRAQALNLLNASDKQQQDGRWMLARDLVASWLNFLGSSYVGAANDTDSARHYMDEAIAWLRQTSANSDHILNPTSDFTSGTKVGTSTAPWTTGFDFDGTAGVQNDVPASGDILGQSVNLDILGGGILHTGLDHYNNFGFV